MERKDWRPKELRPSEQNRHRIWDDVILGKGTGEEVAQRGKDQISSARGVGSLVEREARWTEKCLQNLGEKVGKSGRWCSYSGGWTS